MRVLVLGPNRLTVLGGVEATEERITPDRAAGFDLLVSYGYRHILGRDVLDVTPAVNLHISLLPWNRGADPNLWSWIDGTPKGVTVHWMTEGVDKGPIIAQREVDLDPRGTLAETYGVLQDAMVDVFTEAWPAIVSGDPGTEQPPGGSYHRAADKPPDAMQRGWETPCWMVRQYGLGREQRRVRPS